MNPDFKGRGAPGWQAGAEAWPNLVVVHESPRGTSPRPSPPPLPRDEAVSSAASARGLALESLRITSSSSMSSAFGGRAVQKVERKGDEPKMQAAPPDPPGEGTPARSLHGLGGASPEMARFHALSRHLAALPLSRKAARQEEGGSDGLLRRQMARVMTQAQLHLGEALTLAQVCERLVGLEGFSPALVGLVAGAMALELGSQQLPQADKGRLVDAVLKGTQRDTAKPGGDPVAVAILESLCEVFHGTGHWMPQAAPFVRLVVGRLLALPSSSSSSPRSLALLRVVTTRMLLATPPAQLPVFLGQVLDEPFLARHERADRLRALVAGLADKTSPPPNDACVGKFLGPVLQAGYPESDLIVFATELARHRALWEQACQPRVLEPVALGRLLLARTGVGYQDGKAAKTQVAGPATTQASVQTSRGGEGIETKSGARRTPAVAVDRVAQVLALSLSLTEGAEGRLAREIVAVHRALEGAPDALQARQTLKMCILEVAPDALELTNAAMACGWGIAVGAESLSEAGFAALSDSFLLPPAGDVVAWLNNGSLQLGLAAARDLNRLPPELAADVDLRLQVTQVCREARGPISDSRFGAELMLFPQLDESPLASALWLDELVKQFTGPDFDLLATARSYLLDLAQALLAGDPFAAAYGLDQMSRFAGRIQEAAYNVVSRRYDQCLWIKCEVERKALLAIARDALAFLEQERAAYLEQDPPLALAPAQVVGLSNSLLNLRDAIQQMEPPRTEEPPRSLAGLSVSVGKGKAKDKDKS